MIPLSTKTEVLTRRIFGRRRCEQALSLLCDECSEKVPWLGKVDGEAIERVRFAALKVSNGDLEKLHRAISLAQHDWRDLLMAAGFGHSISEHERWAEGVLGTETK